MSRIYLLPFFLFLCACSGTETRFTLMPPDETGIDFVNRLVEQDTLNILDNEFVYNGAGVAIGDLNGDGLQDLFFNGNQSSAKLYLNRGDWRFEDISQAAGIQTGKWAAGVTLVDINDDGKTDIYISNTLTPDREKTKNTLFINQGNDANGIPTFRDLAAEYGLDDDGEDSSSAFFDYDNDGDLDVFIAINFIDRQYPNQYVTRVADGSEVTRDRLYRNDWSDSLQHAVFTDVSLNAGIVFDGYSHSVLINDFNKDGWKDIYVCNDYISNDLLYINNGDGTFTDRLAEYMKHLSLSAMGSDIGDINNDGLEDMAVCEMMPFDNKRKKLFLNANNYNSYLLTEQYKYNYQYTRNTLQLNQGKIPGKDAYAFSDIAFLAGMQETDWSWTCLFADLDNDSWRDLLITNGFPRDITDHDFGAFRNGPGSTLISKEELYDMIPQIKVPNFLFRNRGDLTFEDVSNAWGINRPSFTNGTAYGDLDNDGDLDFVTNNINDYSFVYRNNLNNPKEGVKANFLRIDLIGPKGNPDAFGTEVRLYRAASIQYAQVLSGRGYLSKSENTIHFGMGKEISYDSIVVSWPDGTASTLKGLEVNKTHKISHSSAVRKAISIKKSAPLLSGVNPASIGIDYKNLENDFIDFNIQRTLPHKFSQYGPGFAVGDINGDGLEDVIFGGSSRFDEVVYLQQPGGRFDRKEISLKPNYLKKEEDLGLLLFDADGDGDNDLYIARGSGQHDKGTVYYQHMLGVNDGKGRFRMDTTAIENLRTNGSTVRAADIDGDGDLDLFAGGRVLPKNYPKTDNSFLLLNESSGKDKPSFRDVTDSWSPMLRQIGLVSDALFTDFNNDNKPDLMIAAEWSSLIMLKNTGKGFERLGPESGLDGKNGWWNSLAATDFDHDGDTDYIAGNFGQNIYFKCTDAEPITLYAKDFDGNGLYDPFISCMWRDSTGSKHEYFYHTRDDMVKQLVQIRQKFQTYGQFGAATVDKVFSKEELEGAQILKANWMSSSIVENLGNGTFRVSALPVEAQLAPVYGMLPYDLDDDGFEDLLLVGNDHGMELMQGKADALQGLALRNLKGKGFQSITLGNSGFHVPGDARGLGRIIVGDREMILASQNRDSTRLFTLPTATGRKIIRLKQEEVYGQMTMLDGKTFRKEFHHGTTFVTHGSRSLVFTPAFREIALFDRNGKLTRNITR
ncbi:MAG: VCBS repeat-containing protein [Bacteroidota bacterium]